MAVAYDFYEDITAHHYRFFRPRHGLGRLGLLDTDAAIGAEGACRVEPTGG